MQLQSTTAPDPAPVPRSAAAIDPFENAEAPRGKVRLCGPIVSPNMLLDVVNMLGVSGWTGELHVRGPGVTFRMTLHRGGLENASSDDPAHRLGALLVRAGRLEAAALERCVAGLDGRTRIGELLVRGGLINRDELFEALRDQAQQIFYSALLVSSGSFLFTELAADAEPPPIAFHVPIQHLLLEGARRMDEQKRAHVEATTELVQGFSAVLRHVFATAAGHGHVQEIHDRVGHWIAGCGLSGLLGDDLRPDGSLDSAALLEYVECSAGQHPLGVVYRMLHELTTFTLFAAGPTMPRAAELRLAGQVTRALRSIEVPPR